MNIQKENICNELDKGDQTEKRFKKLNFIVCYLIVFLIFAVFFIHGTGRLRSRTNIWHGDPTAYLVEANLIKNNGGIINFINLCINGKYKQANQHPLYILFISPFASRETSFYQKARIVSLILGAILIFFVLIIGKKKYGILCGTIAAVGLVSNQEFALRTTEVASESVLMIFSFLTMYFVYEGFRSNRLWIGGGIFAGLTYLAKGTGLFLLPGFFLSSLIIIRLKVVRNKYFWLFFIFFILAASPLLIRNFIHYGNPIFNVNTKRISFEKSELDEKLYSITSPKIGSAFPVYPKGNQGKFQKDIDILSISNFINGLIYKSIKNVGTELKIFFTLLNVIPASILPSGYFRVFFGIIILAFFIIGLSREKNYGGIIYFTSTFLIFLFCLTLFRPIYRYFLPLLPFVWLYAAIGIITVTEYLNKIYISRYIKLNKIHAYLVMLITCLFLSGYVVSRDVFHPQVISSDCVGSRYKLLNWLKQHLDENDSYVGGPQFNWQLERGVRLSFPQNAKQNFEKFHKFLKKKQVKFVIVEWCDQTKNFEEKKISGKKFRYLKSKILENQKLYQNYIEFNSEVGLVELNEIEDWNLVYKENGDKVSFLVYKINTWQSQDR